MKTAVIGEKTYVEAYACLVKKDSFFRLLGTYSTDTKTLKVSQHSIISSFGLIHQADCVFIQKNNELSFVLMTEAVKDGKNVLVFDPHLLTTEESTELYKLSQEAQVDVFTVSPFVFHPAMHDVFAVSSSFKFLEVNLEVPISAEAKEEENLMNTLVYLFDMVFAYSPVEMKKTQVYLTRNAEGEMVYVLIELNNATAAVLRGSSMTSSKSLCIRVIQEKECWEVFPWELRAIRYFSKNKSRSYSCKEALPDVVLREFEKACHEEKNRLRLLSHFQTSLKIKKMIQDKQMMA